MARRKYKKVTKSLVVSAKITRKAKEALQAIAFQKQCTVSKLLADTIETALAHELFI